MFLEASNTPDEVVDQRAHFWISRPELTGTEDLYCVKVIIPPGGSHPFHYHPGKEEIIHILSGQAHLWIGEAHRDLGPGESAWIPASEIHAAYNLTAQDLVFLAIISPGSAPGGMTVDVFENEPWKSRHAGMTSPDSPASIA